MTRWLALALLAACQGETGTVQLELVTAPGSSVLDAVQRLRVTLTDPLTVVEAPRTENGFNLALDVEATGAAGALIVEGFDDTDALVATGASPEFAIAAIDARVVIYVAAPLTIAPAATRLPAARIGVASTPLSFGFAIAGGETADGTLTDSLFIYNAFDHSVLAGLAMPAPKSFQTLATGANNAVYLFGGLGDDGAPTGSLWRFDTNAKPNGSYVVELDVVDLARAGEAAVTLRPEQYVITGAPPVDLVGGRATGRTDVAALGPGATALVDSAPIAIFGGDPAQRLAGGAITALPVSTSADAVAVAVGTRVVFTGDTTELLVIDAAGDATSMVDALSTIRHRPAIAATTRHVVVAGGTDDAGVPLDSADILDAVTLERLVTVPCFARSGASAHALANDQIAIVGGEPANDLIELFTPPPL